MNLFVPHVLQYKQITYCQRTLTLCGSGGWVIKIVCAIVREWASWKYRGWGSILELLLYGSSACWTVMHMPLPTETRGAVVAMSYFGAASIGYLHGNALCIAQEGLGTRLSSGNFVLHTLLQVLGNLL